MNYNKIYLQYAFPDFLNDKNNKFVMVDLKDKDIFDYLSINQIYNYNKSNIYFYYHYIYNNVLFDYKETKRLEYFYLKVQLFKFIFSRFINIVKLKVKKKFNSQTLLFTPFKKNYISLLENNIVYNFDIIEIYKITNNSFNYQEFGSPKFIPIKNPYTNIPFCLHNIINIFFILMNYYKVPKLFYLYFFENLNQRLLYLNYKINIYINCLTEKYKNFNSKLKMRNIKLMLNTEIKYKYFLSFSQDLLFKLFEKNTLYYYLYKNIKNNYEEQEELLDNYKNIYTNHLEKMYILYFFNNNNNLINSLCYNTNIQSYITQTINNLYLQPDPLLLQDENYIVNSMI